MIINSLGTLLYSFIYGKKVGQDEYGNKFYMHKKKKWVLYKNKVDPTSLEVIWQLWLTDKNLTNPTSLNKKYKTYKWQKNNTPNYTGTKKSYHPKISKTNKY